MDLGAGIGDLAHHFLDLDCTVTAIEGRPGNVAAMQTNLGHDGREVGHPGNLRIQQSDLSQPEKIEVGKHDIVLCYGILYHVPEPLRLLQWAAEKSSCLLLVDSVVMKNPLNDVVQVDEDLNSPTQAVATGGCRPTRRYVYDALLDIFPYVYLPKYQPSHEDYATDWTTLEHAPEFCRAIFIASHGELTNEHLSSEFLMHQGRL